MATPFAAMEERVNSGALAMLANADADFGGGLVVSGIFTEHPEMINLVQSSNPIFQCQAASIAGIGYGDAVTIKATAYIVLKVDIDETGWAIAELQEA